MAKQSVEVEIKLAIRDTSGIRRALRKLGFTPTARQHERDTVLDTADATLRRRGSLLRLRRRGKRCILTYKGPPNNEVRYKSRPEFETEAADRGSLLRILDGLGYRPVFLYEKLRTNYRPPKGSGVASLDATPIGTYLELEGPRAWIDRTARALGFGPRDYVTASYGALYFQFCREHGIEPANMVFGEQPSRERKRQTGARLGLAHARGSVAKPVDRGKGR